MRRRQAMKIEKRITEAWDNFDAALEPQTNVRAALGYRQRTQWRAYWTLHWHRDLQRIRRKNRQS